MSVKKGQNASDLQTANRSLVLQILSEKKVCTRVELARLTGLSQASITIIVNFLIEAGLVREVGITAGKNGRRSIAIALNEDKYKVVAVSMNRSFFQVGLFDLGGTCYDSYKEEIRIDLGANSTLQRIIGAVERLIRDRDDVYAIGMAVPGPFLRKERRIALLTEFQGWTDIDLVEAMERAFSLPTWVEHDANAGVMGEWRYGNFADKNSTMIQVLTGDGIGAGVLDNGHIFFGSNGIAGQFGHMSLNVHGPRCACGNYGCLELYCTTFSLARCAKEELHHHPESVLNRHPTITYTDVFDGMEKGDGYCIDLIKQLGFYLGCGVVNLINAYDPRYIILSGVLAQRGSELLLTTVRHTVKQRILPEFYKMVDIVYSELPVYSVLLGAAAIATSKLIEHPNLLLDTKEQVMKQKESFPPAGFDHPK